MKNTNLTKPAKLFRYLMDLMGLSSLDGLVILTIPFTNLISTLCYLRSFRKSCKGISKVCIYLTHLNKEMYGLTGNISSKTRQYKCGQSLKFFVFGSTLTSLVLTLLTLSWFTALREGVIGDELLLEHERIPFAIVMVVWNYCWIYPTIAISADFVSYHLLVEVKQSLDKWNTLLEFNKQKIKPMATYSDTPEEQIVVNVFKP